MLVQVWEFVQAIGEWPDLTISTNPCVLCIALHDVTLGHLRWNGRLELLFGPELRDPLIAEEMAALDPGQPDSGRLVFDLRTLRDMARAVWLLRLAYLSTGRAGGLART